MQERQCHSAEWVGGCQSGSTGHAALGSLEARPGATVRAELWFASRGLGQCTGSAHCAQPAADGAAVGGAVRSGDQSIAEGSGEVVEHWAGIRETAALLAGESLVAAAAGAGFHPVGSTAALTV